MLFFFKGLVYSGRKNRVHISSSVDVLRKRLICRGMRSGTRFRICLCLKSFSKARGKMHRYRRKHCRIQQNRELLYGALSEYGFDCIHPEGAFYLFVKAPEGNAEKFAQAAKNMSFL